MRSLSPYLMLGGRGEEALEFYARALGGRVRDLRRVGDVNPDAPPEVARRVIHGEVEAGDLVLMVSDGDGECPASQASGPVAVCLRLESHEAQDRVWATLSEGATITCALEQAFWGDRFGALTDRFGVAWMLVCGGAGA